MTEAEFRRINERRSDLIDRQTEADYCGQVHKRLTLREVEELKRLTDLTDEYVEERWPLAAVIERLQLQVKRTHWEEELEPAE